MNDMGLLIFDMDGTLVNSMNQHADIFSKILNDEYGVPHELSKQEYIKTAGQPLDDQFNCALFRAKGVLIKDMSVLLSQFWMSVEKQQPVLFPEVLDVIEQLSKAGYTLVVISGCAPIIVQTKLRKTNTHHYFKLMLGTDKNIPGMVKGEDHLRIIQRDLFLTPEQFRANSVLIGDSEYDMAIAKRFGLLAIGRITNENGDVLIKAGAGLLIDNLIDLKNLLEHRGSPSNTFIPVSEIRSALYEVTV